MAMAVAERQTYNAHIPNTYSYKRPQQVLRGDVYFVNFGEGKGSIQGGWRPALVIQNNVGNKFSPTVIVACVSSQIEKMRLPTHVPLPAAKHGFDRESYVMFEQLKTVNKSDLGDKITHLDDITMREIDNALALSVGISLPLYN